MDTSEMKYWATKRKKVCELMLESGADPTLWVSWLPAAEREEWGKYHTARVARLRSLFGKVEIIYEDPPWRFQNWSIGEKAKYGEKWARKNGRSPYDVIETFRLKDLRVDRFAAKDCIRFTWETSPKRKEVIDYIESQKIVTSKMGKPVFEYKTVGFTWLKPTKEAFEKGVYTEADFRMMCGYWTRKNVEQCLLSTKGSPKRYNKCVKEPILYPVTEHSAKPPETRDRIRALAGEGVALELFARHPVPEGWEATGLDYDAIDLFDVIGG